MTDHEFRQTKDEADEAVSKLPAAFISEIQKHSLLLALYSASATAGLILCILCVTQVEPWWMCALASAATTWCALSAKDSAQRMKQRAEMVAALFTSVWDVISHAAERGMREEASID